MWLAFFKVSGIFFLILQKTGSEEELGRGCPGLDSFPNCFSAVGFSPCQRPIFPLQKIYKLNVFFATRSTASVYLMKAEKNIIPVLKHVVGGMKAT